MEGGKKVKNTLSTKNCSKGNKVSKNDLETYVPTFYATFFNLYCHFWRLSLFQESWRNKFHFLLHIINLYSEMNLCSILVYRHRGRGIVYTRGRSTFLLFS